MLRFAQYGGRLERRAVAPPDRSTPATSPAKASAATAFSTSRPSSPASPPAPRWGDDDGWDIGLRYEGEFNGFKIEAGIAYGENTDQCADRRSMRRTSAAPWTTDGGATAKWQLGGSISVMHEPSGLYGNFAAGKFEDDDVAAPLSVAAQTDDEHVLGDRGRHPEEVDRSRPDDHVRPVLLERWWQQRRARQLRAGDADQLLRWRLGSIFESDVEMLRPGHRAGHRRRR